jgi:hypothetical protein
MLKSWRFSTVDLRIQESPCSETLPPGVAKRYPDRSFRVAKTGRLLRSGLPPLTEVFGWTCSVSQDVECVKKSVVPS